MVVLTVSGIGCPFFYMFQIPCPTCGTTRAICALMKLNLREYLLYQPFGVPIMMSIWMMLHAHVLGRKKIVFWFTMVSAGGNFVFYLIRLWWFFQS